MSLKYLLSSNDTDLVNTGMVTKFKPYDSTKKNKILGSTPTDFFIGFLYIVVGGM